MTTQTNPRYDTVPYESHSFHQSHPRWLATVAHLFGLEPPCVERCRILELGCASGGNLLPIAESLPASQCLGLDLSRRQIEEGQAFAHAAGLTNVELRQQSILDVGSEIGTFDYIICHGVFSWVARDAQDKILDICAELLAPNGVAYVSYNVYPGWRMLGMLRDMMRYHSARFGEPKEQIAQARAILNVLARTVPSQDNPYGQLLKRESEALRHRSDSYLYHEQLEPDNEPVYFYQFVERAAERGLQFLGESDVWGMLTERFPSGVQEALCDVATSLIYAEQYMDFFRNRAFRRTLLCHKNVTLNRQLTPDLLMKFRFGSALRPLSVPAAPNHPEPVKFAAAGWPSVTLPSPLSRAAVSCLRDVWPQHLDFDGLFNVISERLAPTASTESERIACADMLWHLASHGVVQISHTAPPCAARPGVKPKANVVARTQAARGGRWLTNLLHRQVILDDSCRRLLPLLSGELGREELWAALNASEPAGSAVSRENVEESLAKLADAAMLVA